MLEVRDIRKTYEGQTLLAGVSFDVHSGEIVCLLGESGSGKSTLLRIIAGLEPCEAGQICWDGADMSAIPPHKRGFGLMFQDYALFPHRTVAENVAFGLRMQQLPKPEVEAKTLEALRAIRMESFADRSVTELSGGEQQMLSVGRALMARPKLIMMDEPSLGLAPLVVKGIFDIIRRINDEGVTVLLIEQNANAALKIANRGYVLETGSIIMTGSGSELLNNEKVKQAYLGKGGN